MPTETTTGDGADATTGAEAEAPLTAEAMPPPQSAKAAPGTARSVRIRGSQKRCFMNFASSGISLRTFNVARSRGCAKGMPQHLFTHTHAPLERRGGAEFGQGDVDLLLPCRVWGYLVLG